MPLFLIILLIIILLPVIFVFLLVNGAVNNVKRFFSSARKTENVKHRKHMPEIIEETVTVEAEYSEEDIIEAEFEEIEIENDEQPPKNDS